MYNGGERVFVLFPSSDRARKETEAAACSISNGGMRGSSGSRACQWACASMCRCVCVPPPLPRPHLQLQLLPLPQHTQGDCVTHMLVGHQVSERGA
jgi:hypothetical protein